jgi:hypothetical protein
MPLQRPLAMLAVMAAHAVETHIGGSDGVMHGLPIEVGEVDATLATVAIPAGLPETFDWYEANPNCTSPIQDQRSCGSCWAFAATGTLADRQCATTGQAVQLLSVQDLLNCDDLLGCTMGVLPGLAWKALEKKGVATAQCLPYRFKKERCTGTCEDGQPVRRLRATNVTHLHGAAAMMAAIYQGPIDVTFNVHKDFMSFWESRTEVPYEHKSGLFTGIHSVKMVGWGTASGVPYWLCQNSWGEYSGGIPGGASTRGGFFRIRRGTPRKNGECGIEGLAYAGWPVATH